MQKTPIFLAAFVKRYWRLLIVFILLNAAGKWDAITYFCGPIFYLVQLTVGAIVSALLICHMFFRQTLDEFAQDKDQPDGKKESDFLVAWRNMNATDKVTLRICVLCVFFLGACWVAASIAK